MYETPRRMWRDISEIPNFGYVVWAVTEYSHKITKEDEIYIPDRDGHAMMVWATHHWTRDEAYDFYLRVPRTDRYELIYVKPGHEQKD